MRRMVLDDFFFKRKIGEKIFLRCILVFVLKQPYQFIIYTFFSYGTGNFF